MLTASNSSFRTTQISFLWHLCVVVFEKVSGHGPILSKKAIQSHMMLPSPLQKILLKLPFFMHNKKLNNKRNVFHHHLEKTSSQACIACQFMLFQNLGHQT